MPIGEQNTPEVAQNLSVAATISALWAPSRSVAMKHWRAALVRRGIALRPDLSSAFEAYIGEPPSNVDFLRGLSIGEMGAVYEALLALSDRASRKTDGQYFTPDDIAEFIARESARFPNGIWLDPCCGIGNLSFHLAKSRPNPSTFIERDLVLIDRDPVALRSAVVLLVAHFGSENGQRSLTKLSERAHVRDYLGKTPLPAHDFVILNPPYAKAPRRADLETGATGELYAYFLEQAGKKASGFISITPASLLSGVKYASARRILERRSGGRAFIFDNVPDTCFRGFKYGSSNSSKTNFVRATIISSAPSDERWEVTPILRWAARSRARMLQSAPELLRPLRKSHRDDWAKLMPGTEAVWASLDAVGERLGDLIVPHRTELSLEVAATPRYYISASARSLDRGSKHVLHFATRAAFDRAYLVLNSSIAYWWWRTLDGGVTLRRRDLLDIPVPRFAPNKSLLSELNRSDHEDIVTKVNAGRTNENVKRPRCLVDSIDEHVLGGIEDYDFASVYAADLFTPSAYGLARNA